jgi:hypothetical protein
VARQIDFLRQLENLAGFFNGNSMEIHEIVEMLWVNNM